MKRNLTKDEQRRLLGEQLYDIWESLSSHIYYTYHDEEGGKNDRRFHVDTVKKYAKQMYKLTKLL